MSELIEKGLRPENCNPSYVTCPKCHATCDYWQSGMNTARDERIILFCLNCHDTIEVYGLGDGCLRVKNSRDKD